MKARGGVLGVILVVAVLGYMILSGQLSAGQLIEELLGGGGSRVPTTAQSIPSTEAAQRQLSELMVRPAGSMAGYSSDEFPHWSDAQEFGWRLPSGTPDPDSCDARDAALIRDGRGERVEEFCDIVSGRWFDPYGGQTYTASSDIDIEHIVPLANAWRSGASSWDTAKRESFANMPRNLLSVDDGLNQSKGDKGPEAWKPPREAHWCTFSKRWIGINISGSSRSRARRMPLWRRCSVPAVANGVGEELRSTFTSTVGGVMTEEAGAITGELELLTYPTSEAGDAQLEVLVRYAGADEWYAVSGSPLAKPAGEEDHRAAHEEALTRLTTPSPVQGGNELPVDLRGW